MEASTIALRGDDADRFADAFADTKARESERSLNKRGVRNIHRYDGDGFTQIAYERAAAYENSWLMVSVLVEATGDRSCTVVVLVGGGGQGPFKLEEVSPRRVLRGEEAVGEAGRFATVLRDVDRVVESLDLEVTTRWETDTESSMTARIAEKIFEA